MKKEIAWENKTAAETAKELKTDAEQGLTEEEAAERLADIGPNKLPEEAGISASKVFFRQFASFIIWFLFAAGVLAGFLGEWIDSIAIGAIVLLNAIVGFIQEYRAEKSLAALKKMRANYCKVIRNGEKQSVLTEKLVPGDLVLLESGDKVPADGRIVKSFQLQAQEAALTGESSPVEKTADRIEGEDIPLGDRRNMVYKGCAVTFGKGFFLVTGTGLNTELGKIAAMLQETKEGKTPLQQKLAKLGHKLVWICLGLIVFIFGLSLLLHISWITAILTALSLAVAAVPEGLPAVVTIALAAGVSRMVKRKALVRKLPSIETLGCATVICTDKTGTLTRNEMQVQKIWAGGKVVQVTGEGYKPQGDFIYKEKKILAEEDADLSMALAINVLCNNAHLKQENGNWEVVGDPTEGSLLVAAKKAGMDPAALLERYPEINEIPFDSERKMMSVLRKNDGGLCLYVKGAPDVVLSKAAAYQENEQIIELSRQKKEEILQKNDDLASQGLRVLAVAYKKQDEEKIQEEKLVFAGLMAMRDPPRDEAKIAMEKCAKAGIRTVMITGDHQKTAEAIARELGFFHEGKRAVNGIELDRMTQEDLQRDVKDISVYSRVSAKHKLRIINAWKSKGEVVAMTGDGVNDAPAVKRADIGVAMGITGTDVTKEVSDLIILDDNFASIVNAVEEGRGIFRNIIKFVLFLLASNMAEILVILFGMLFGLGGKGSFVVLLPIQLLWINLVTDGFPAIALGVDPIDSRVMQQKPRRPSRPILTKGNFLQMSVVSILIGAGTLIACYIGLKDSMQKAQTMAFTALVVLELIQAQIFRSQYGVSLFANFWFPLALCVSFFCQLAVLYIPFLHRVFQTSYLGLQDWIFLGIICLAVGSISWVFSRLYQRCLQEK